MRMIWLLLLLNFYTRENNIQWGLVFCLLMLKNVKKIYLLYFKIKCLKILKNFNQISI